MDVKPLPRFEEALQAADQYYQSCVNARDRQYDFLARAYTAFREGQKRKTAYAKALEIRLGHEPTGIQKERPFLCLLRALLGPESTKARHSLPQYSKLAGALEAVHDEFSKRTPHLHEITKYIKLHGGVTGLYEKHVKNNRNATQEATEEEHKPHSHPQDLLSLPEFGMKVRRSGKRYKLVLPDLKPGAYLVRTLVGSDGVVREWRVEAEADPVFKPVLKTG